MSEKEPTGTPEQEALDNKIAAAQKRVERLRNLLDWARQHIDLVLEERRKMNLSHLRTEPEGAEYVASLEREIAAAERELAELEGEKDSVY